MKLRPKKSVIGTARCVCCEREIPAKQSETGTLDLSCQWCDLPTYAKPGTEAHRILLARVIRTANDTLPTPEPKEHLHEKPTVRAARTFFDLTAAKV